MNALDTLLDTPLAYHLGWTLVHFLWQGLLVGAVYTCARPLFADASPQLRYWLSLGTLFALAVLPVATFIYLLTAPVAAPVITGIAGSGADLAPVPPASFFDALRQALHPLIPWTVPAWCTGVALLALKSYLAWRRARTLTRNAAEPAPEAWQETVAWLAVRVGVRIRISLMVTAKVAVPCVVGWLKPVILLPPAAFSGLTPLQLEMVLAHELSHIRRHDYLVNLIQVAVETLLFYHPVVRWISRDVRRERELCCDDSAVQARGDALHYAHALTDLEMLRIADLSPALGVNGGDLVMRVERLIAQHHAAPLSAPRLTSLMLVSALCLGGMLALASARHMPVSVMQSFALRLPHLQQTADETLTPVLPTTLLPSRVSVQEPRIAQPAVIRFARFEPGAVRDAPLPLPEALAPTEPVEDPSQAQVGGANLASLLGPSDAAPSPLDMNKRATAPTRIINVNKSSAPAGGHPYCEPITGSRVCNR